MAMRRALHYVDSALVVYGREALVAERKAAELLARRLRERSGVRAAVSDDLRYDPQGWEALILVGHPDRHLVAAALMASHGVRRPSQTRPGPEGYVVRQVGRRRTPTVVIAGSDSRGCLYGVGAFLRALDLAQPGQVGLPYLKISSAPAFSIRGSDLKFWQEQREDELGMGMWSLEQWEEQLTDLALWGVNLVRRQLLFSPFDDWLNEHELMIEDGLGRVGWELERQINQLIHAYGLEVGISYPPNTIASSASRSDWHPGSPWPRLACPSLPAARDRILYERLQIFKELEHIDHFFIPPYEIGFCDCENCRPWARTYLELARDTVKYLQRYHPGAQLWLSNQGFGPQENEMLWELLAQERPDWFRVIQYGPTLYGLPVFTAQTSSGDSRQQRVRPSYPALGTLTQTLQETVRHVPVDYKLVLGPDVTHTFQPQYGLEHVDPALLWLHTYESPFARPLGYHEVFRATAGASAGAMLYSEGLYDDLNKTLWAEWTWSPDLSPWEATLAYARWWFGKSAARLVAEAILLSEANWENPLLGNDQVEQVVLQLDRAEMHIPPHLQEGNWRWTMWRLRGLLDLLAQHKLDLAQETRSVVHAMLSEALTKRNGIAEGVEAACDLLDLRQREARLGWLREEIRDLNDLLDYQIGLRLPAVANLDAELSNLGWELAQLQKALKAYEAEPATGLARLRRAILLCLNYENPGPGGHYDDCGHIGRDPHFVSGHRIPAAHGLDPHNRPSANTFAAGFGETDDVIFAYNGLNPEVDYRVRLTLACPQDDEDKGESPASPAKGEQGAGPGVVQKLYATGFLVHNDLRVPGGVARQYVFDLPRQAYDDGRLELRFMRSDPGYMAAVSEIWLIQTQPGRR